MIQSAIPPGTANAWLRRMFNVSGGDRGNSLPPRSITGPVPGARPRAPRGKGEPFSYRVFWYSTVPASARPCPRLYALSSWKPMLLDLPTFWFSVTVGHGILGLLVRQLASPTGSFARNAMATCELNTWSVYLT